MQLELPLFTRPNQDKGENEWIFDLIDKYQNYEPNILGHNQGGENIL
jgi:hypothetical protein